MKDKPQNLVGYSITIIQTEKEIVNEIQLPLVFRTKEEAALYMEQNYPTHEWRYCEIEHEECKTFEELSIKWAQMVEKYYETHKHLKRKIRTALH
jgi:hypothetical protein